MHLYRLSKEIIKRIDVIIESFIWSCTKMGNKIHLVSMDIITKKKEFGGWGIINTEKFGWALLSKRFWRDISSSVI